MSKFFALIGATTIIAVLAITGVYLAYVPARDCSNSVIAGGKAAIGGPFTLTNHEGVKVTDKDVITGPTLIYFGFTYCPDVCPLDTARNAEAIDLLDAKGFDVTPVFISIDPARDTPAALADFVEVLHPRMIGLTGSQEEVKAASQAYKTYYKKNGEGEDYLMDHSTFTYLMGPDGLWEFFRRDVPAAEMAETVACFINQS